MNEKTCQCSGWRNGEQPSKGDISDVGEKCFITDTEAGRFYYEDRSTGKRFVHLV